MSIATATKPTITEPTTGKATTATRPTTVSNPWASSLFVDCMSMSPEVNLAGYGIEADHFRSVAGSLPTGVSVVTTVGPDGQPVGMTSGAVCSLSANPPLLLTCIGNESRTLDAIRKRGTFAVNILAGDASEISGTFASRAEDKFATVAHETGPRGIPVLTEGVVAHAVCDVHQLIDAGDHTIVIGHILEAEHTEEVAPLVYFRREYAEFPSSPTA